MVRSNDVAAFRLRPLREEVGPPVVIPMYNAICALCGHHLSGVDFRNRRAYHANIAVRPCQLENGQ